MSYALEVYSVPLDKLRAIFGSGEESWLDKILEDDEHFVDDTDTIYEADEDETYLTCREAILRLIHGQ